MSNRLVVYSKIPDKIRNKEYGVNHFRFRFLQITTILVFMQKKRVFIRTLPLANCNSGNFG